MTGKMFLRRKTAIILFSVGLLLVVVSVVLFACFPSLYNFLLGKQLLLLSGTAAFKMWRDIPLPIYEKLYFFNITNADEFLNNHAKPNLTQVGPYTYTSKWIKEDIGWFHNGTVSYREIRTFHFDREKSAGSEDDVIFTLNGPMTLGASMLKTYGFIGNIGASILFGLYGETIIIQRSIKELTYGGYEDIIAKLSPLLKPNLPFKNGMFSWLAGKNATDDGLFTVYTGEEDLKKLNVIERWNGKKRLEFWRGKTCNMMNGSSGEMGPPITENQQEYEFFQSLLCRTWTLKYEGEVDNLGIESKRFVATESILANKTVNPDNYCYETENKLLNGGLDISECQFGAPIVMTFPHFYLADPSYLEAVVGLQPIPEKHSTYLDVHPTTGFSVKVIIRIQFNLLLQRIPGIVQFQKIPELVFPLFWAEIDVSLTDDFAKMIKDKTKEPKIIAYSVLGVLVLIGLILVILGGVSLIVIWKQGKEKAQSKTDDDDDDSLLNPSGNDEVRNNDGRKEEASSENSAVLIEEESDVALIDGGDNETNPFSKESNEVEDIKQRSTSQQGK